MRVWEKGLALALVALASGQAPPAFAQDKKDFVDIDAALAQAQAELMKLDTLNIKIPSVDLSDMGLAGMSERLALMLTAAERNSQAIRSSPLLAAFLDGQEPDSGTVAELGYAAGLGKLCFGLRTDLRQAGEEGALLNIQVESLVLESGGRIVASLSELVAALGAAARD